MPPHNPDGILFLPLYRQVVVDSKVESESAIVPRPRGASVVNSTVSAVTVKALEVTASMGTMVLNGSSEAAKVFEAGIPGTAYVLVNARYPGQALTVDMIDRKTIIGYPTQFGQNQQWEFVPSGAGFAIRSMLPQSGGKKLYLSVGDWTAGSDDVKVVASTFPVAWNIDGSKKGIRYVVFGPARGSTLRIYGTPRLIRMLRRIEWPNSDVAFELEEDYDGNSTNNKVRWSPLSPVLTGRDRDLLTPPTGRAEAHFFGQALPALALRPVHDRPGVQVEAETLHGNFWDMIDGGEVSRRLIIVRTCWHACRIILI